MSDERITTAVWPALPFGAWRETSETLQLWTQVVGKIRLVQTPWLNHSWHVTLYLTFSADHQHASYDREYAHRFWRVLLQTDRIFKDFRTRFLGKSSPVHFFWGSFDLAVTRFSGRPAPRHPGGVPNLPDEVAHEAYSHEVSSAGFWPGAGLVDYPAFYSYAYPEPAGYRDVRVRPAGAFYHEQLKEFVLPYDVVRTAASPDAALMDFLQSTYEAAADQGHWDRAALECEPGRPGIPRGM